MYTFELNYHIVIFQVKCKKFEYYLIGFNFKINNIHVSTMIIFVCVSTIFSHNYVMHNVIGGVISNYF